MIRFKKILCPMDFFKRLRTPSSTRSSWRQTMRRRFMHFMSLRHYPSTYGAPFSLADMTADFEKEARRLLQKARAQGEQAHVSVTTEVRLGDIDGEILRSVATQKADLVVMGTHGRRGFERLVMGSVTERMTRHCPVPLLTVGSAKRAARRPPIFDESC
jgi:nucleotide-binding universal stress UspA family protein